MNYDLTYDAIIVFISMTIFQINLGLDIEYTTDPPAIGVITVFVNALAICTDIYLLSLSAVRSFVHVMNLHRYWRTRMSIVATFWVLIIKLLLWVCNAVLYVISYWILTPDTDPSQDLRIRSFIVAIVPLGLCVVSLPVAVPFFVKYS